MTDNFYEELIKIYSLEKEAFSVTKEAFKTLYESASAIVADFGKKYPSSDIAFSIKQHNDHEFELVTGSDALTFLLHPNVFEFPRNHQVMNTPYIREDKDRAQCGMIMIYNFLTDDITYSNSEGIGYLIGRILVNKENHLYVEGKKEVAMLINHFDYNVLDAAKAHDIIVSAIEYAMHFGVLLPDYDLMKELPAEGFFDFRDSRRFKTAKRMGFTFNRDLDNV